MMNDDRQGREDAGDAQAEAPQQAKLQIRDADAKLSYCNFFMVSSTPDEVVLNLGVNLLPMTKERELRVDISNKIVMSYVSAKRLAITLSNLIQRYEADSGVIEVDARRRRAPGAGDAAIESSN